MPTSPATAAPSPAPPGEAARPAAVTVSIAGLTWLGHATVLIELGGRRVLTDPLLRDRVAHLRRHHPAPGVPGPLARPADSMKSVVLPARPRGSMV